MGGSGGTLAATKGGITSAPGQATSSCSRPLQATRSVCVCVCNMSSVRMGKPPDPDLLSICLEASCARRPKWTHGAAAAGGHEMRSWRPGRPQTRRSAIGSRWAWWVGGGCGGWRSHPRPSESRNSAQRRMRACLASLRVADVCAPLANSHQRMEVVEQCPDQPSEIPTTRHAARVQGHRFPIVSRPLVDIVVDQAPSTLLLVPEAELVSRRMPQLPRSTPL